MLQRARNETIRIQCEIRGFMCAFLAGVYVSSLGDSSCQSRGTVNLAIWSLRLTSGSGDFQQRPHQGRLLVTPQSSVPSIIESKCIEFYRLACEKIAKQNYSDNRNKKSQAKLKKKETWATRRQNKKINIVCGCVRWWTSTSFYLNCSARSAWLYAEVLKKF